MAEDEKQGNNEGEDLPISIGMPDRNGRRVNPWAWVVSVNFLQGLQYAVINILYVIVFFTMGIDKGTAAFAAGILTLPWTIKPLWGPLIDKYWTKRAWTLFMELAVGLAFIGLAGAMLIPGEAPPDGQPPFFWASVVFIFLLAFAAATHDIACDGYYMLALTQKQQAFFVGIRSTAFRFAIIFATGVLVWQADLVQIATGPDPVDVEVQVARGALGDEEPPAEPGVDDVAESVVDDSLVPVPSAPLEPTISSLRGPVDDPDGLAIMVEPAVIALDAGTTGAIAVRLSEPLPEGEKLVVIPAYRTGDKAVSVQDVRMEFTAENWDKPQQAVVSVAERNVEGGAAAAIRFKGGNIPLSWAVVNATCAAFFLLLFAWHWITLPRPHADAVETENRPPFYQPLLAVVATTLVPFLIGYVAYRMMGTYLADPLKAAFFGEELTVAQTKLFDFLFYVGRLILLVGIGWMFFVLPGLSLGTKSFFNAMDRYSRIGFVEVFTTFFSKPGIGIVLAFILTFRLGEAQLATVKNIFLLDGRSEGGLAMTLSQAAFANSVIWAGALVIGGLFGGWLIASYGLKRVIWILVAFMHLPNALYIWLAYAQPDLVWINVVIFVESLGYGIGFAGFLLIMIMAAQGPYKTAHYALCTGFMSLGYLVPMTLSGFLAEIAGYEWFFILVMVFVIPGTLIIPFLAIDPNFGRKSTD